MSFFRKPSQDTLKSEAMDITRQKPPLFKSKSAVSSPVIEQKFQRRLSEGVKETRTIRKDLHPSGNKMINQYMIIKELGRGVHGKVKLVVDTQTDEQWAIKIVEKNSKRRFQSKLSQAHRLALQKGDGQSNPQLVKIYKEIAILKKCSHPHVVGLKEVIDDPQSDKIYMVLECLQGGEIRWQSEFGPLLSLEESRRIFRDLVNGIQYLHCQGIVHRDIKPANLLKTLDKRVKISDFGVSVFVGRPRYHKPTENLEYEIEDSDLDSEHEPTDEMDLQKTAGSPAFFAPELCSPSDPELEHEQDQSAAFESEYVPPKGAPIDIWAMGVTLYCLVFGCVPFMAETEFELFQMISKQPVLFPSPIDDQLKNLLLGMMEKDPIKRFTLYQIRHHPWTTGDLTDLQRQEWLLETDPIQHFRKVLVSDQDVYEAVGVMERLKSQIRKMSTSLHNLTSSLYKKRQSHDSARKEIPPMPPVMSSLPLSVETKAKGLALQKSAPQLTQKMNASPNWKRWDLGSSDDQDSDIDPVEEERRRIQEWK